MDYCTYCPKMCRFSCPVSEVTKDETHTPWGKMEMAHWILGKTLPMSQETAAPLYQCTNCLHCQIYCEHGNDVPEALREVREHAVTDYAAPPGVFTVGKNFSKHNNPYGTHLYENYRLPSLKHWKNPKSKILFFPSCHTIKFFPDRLETYRELFQKLNVPNINLVKGAIPCCGEPLRALGFRHEFCEVAEVHYFSFKTYEYLLTDDAECCFSMADHYRQDGFDLGERVLHLLKFLEPYFFHSNYRTLGKIKRRFAFYDPPFLSRHLGLSELPRKILTHITGYEPLNLSMAREDTLSSGTEGGYEWVYPDQAQALSRRILDEIEGRRIKTLVTASAKAETLFKEIANSIEIVDIFEFLNDQILPPESNS